MRQIPNETIDGSIFEITTNAIQCFEPAVEETVIIGFDEFFMPKFVRIKNVLKNNQQ